MLKPLNGRVIVQVKEEEEEKTISGIVLPSAAKEKPTIGEVLAVAGDVDEEETPIKAGDKVLFEKYAGSTIKYNGEDYLIMKAKDIMAIVE